MTDSAAKSMRVSESVDSAPRWTDVALSGIYEISKVLTRPARIEVTLSRVVTLLSSFLDMSHGLIALLDQEGEPQVVVGSGWTEETALRHFQRLPERAVGEIVVTKAPLLVRNIETDPLFANWVSGEPATPDRLYSFIGVPIKDRDQVIGTITVERGYLVDCEGSIDEDARFLTMIANLVGQTVRLQTLIARDRERLMQEGSRAEKELEARGVPDAAPGNAGIVGESWAIRSVLEKIAIIARSSLPVLLRGESGTGKELFAQAVHNLSPRKSAPCIKLNCAALPESVLESELFGHEKGAFTGAIAQRKGRFELADGGTLFLDEIGDISGAFQAKLLRVLQEGEFERVGGNRTIKVDVRLVTATNRDLEDAVARGTFRADLYYRISVVPILLPPLRDRREDIALLSQEFLQRYNQAQGTSLSLGKDALAVLTACDFPGNVRELESCIRRTAAFAQGSRISADDFACKRDSCMSSLLSKTMTDRQSSRSGLVSLPSTAAAGNPRPRAIAPPNGNGHSENYPVAADSSMARDASAAANTPGPIPERAAFAGHTEREQLTEAMEKAGWVQAKAARLLGLTARQMGYALRKHDISIKRF
jgi:Nif-specific regulatory protein